MRYSGRLAGSALVGAALLLSVPGGAANAATLPTLPITGLTQVIADSVHNHLFLSSNGSVVVTNLAGVKQGNPLFSGAGAMATDGNTVYVGLNGGAADRVGTINATSLATATPYALDTGDVISGVAFQAGKIWVSYSNLPTVTGAIGYFNVGSATFHADALTTAGTWPTAPRLAADPNPTTEGTLVAVDNEASPTMIASFHVSGTDPFPRIQAGENDAFAACTGLSDIAVTAGGAHVILACTGSATDLGYTTNSPTIAPYAAANYAAGANPSAVAIAPDNTGIATGAGAALSVVKPSGTKMTSLSLATAGEVVAPDGLAWANDATKLFAVLKGAGNTYYLDTLVYPQYVASNLDLENTGTGVFTAGTKVTLKGKLTYGTAATIPPLGTTVRILRRPFTSSVNTTLYVKTGTGGAFTVTDVPPAAGSYYYTAYYPGTGTYSKAWHTAAVKVTIAHTTLKVTAGTTLVKKGTTITVTAHLGKWHTNRVVQIFAQPAGGAKVRIKWGSVNAQGILTVKYKMLKKTVFTVTYSGDSWYAKAQASGTVNVK